MRLDGLDEEDRAAQQNGCGDYRNQCTGELGHWVCLARLPNFSTRSGPPPPRFARSPSPTLRVGEDEICYGWRARDARAGDHRGSRFMPFRNAIIAAAAALFCLADAPGLPPLPQGVPQNMPN